MEETNVEMIEKIEQLITSNENLQRKVEEQEEKITMLYSEKQKLAESLQEQIGLVERQNEALKHREPTVLETENARLKAALEKSEQVVFRAEQRTRAADERIEQFKVEFIANFLAQQQAGKEPYINAMVDMREDYESKLEQQKDEIKSLKTELQRPWYAYLLRKLLHKKGERKYETDC